MKGKTTRARQWAAVGLAAASTAAASALVLAWLGRPAQPHQAGQAKATASAVVPAPQAPGTFAGTAPAERPPGGGAGAGSEPARPASLSTDQWQALRAELAQRPDGAAELRRVAEHLAFQDDVRQLRALRQDGTDPSGLLAAAVRIDAALDHRLRERELSGGEASRLKAAVLELTVADPTERSRRLQQWQQARQAEGVASHRPDPREPEFLRRQAAVLAAWQAQPAAQRDPRQLQRDLDALRLASFPEPRPPTGEPR